MIPADLQPQRVLLLRPRGLGDVVLSSAVIDGVRRAWPHARIDFLTERPSRALLEADARLDAVYTLPGGSRAWPKGTGATIRWIRSRRADVVVDLFSNPYTALLTALSGARWRVGLDKRLRRLAYNVRVPRFPAGGAEKDTRWAAEVQLDFLRHAGVRWEGEARPSVALTPADVQAADRGLTELGIGPDDRFGAVLPGGSWESKRWSPEGFAAAAKRLADHTGRPAVVIWGPPEREDADRIVAAAGGAAVLAPPSTLREMAAVLGRPALLVATDCLGRHLAVVQETPTVGIFGSTRPSDWTPPTGPHRTVEGGPAVGEASLRDLDPAPVLAEIDAFFASAPVDLRGGGA